MVRFRGTLKPVPHGGHYVVVPARVAAAAAVDHAARVRGTVNGAKYRSALMKYSGIFHLGVHKATLAAAGVKAPATVTVTIARDTKPLPADRVPTDLARALAASRGAKAAWAVLRPSLKREHVKNLLDARTPETRQRRVARTIASLTQGRRLGV